MTDFMAITFLVPLAVIFWVVALWKDNTFMTIASGLCWAISSMYCFSMYYSGDPSYGATVYGLGWVFAICTFSVLMSSWWAHRKKTLQMTGEKDPFYSEGDIDFKEIREIYKMRDDRNAMRPRRRR